MTENFSLRAQFLMADLEFSSYLDNECLTCLQPRLRGADTNNRVFPVNLNVIENCNFENSLKNGLCIILNFWSPKNAIILAAKC